MSVVELASHDDFAKLTSCLQSSVDEAFKVRLRFGLSRGKVSR